MSQAHHHIYSAGRKLFIAHILMKHEHSSKSAWNFEVIMDFNLCSQVCLQNAFVHKLLEVSLCFYMLDFFLHLLFACNKNHHFHSRSN